MRLFAQSKHFALQVKRLAVRYSTLYNIYTGFYKNKEFVRRATELITASLVETNIPRHSDRLGIPRSGSWRANNKRIKLDPDPQHCFLNS